MKLFIAFVTLLRREITRFLRTWIGSIVPPVITMTLYFIIFGRLVGSQIKPIHGFTYMQYIAPGLIMMSVVTSAYSNVVSALYLLRFQRSIEEILVAPLPDSLFLFAFMLAGMLRSLIIALVITGVALFFTHLTLMHFFAIVFSILLASALFSLAGFLNGLYAKSFDHISFVPTFVLTPLTYLGGVFYSIHMLPAFWQKVSLLNPILYMVNAFRYGILGITDIPIAHALLMMSFFVVSLFLFNWYLLRKGYGVRT